MKEAFEKIIERLEHIINTWEEHCEVWGGDCHYNSCSDCVLYHAIEIVEEVAEEYGAGINVGSNDGWIPCSERLPEEKENPVTMDWYVYPVMVQFEEITDIRYYSFGNGHWHHGPSIMDKYVTRWMDIKPYKPKGE